MTWPGAGRRGTPPASDETSNPLGIGRDVQRTSGSRVSREAPRHLAGERWRQRNADRSSRAAVSSCLRSGEDHRDLAGSRAARDAALHRTRRPTHWASDETSNPLGIGRDVQPTSGSRVPREAPRHRAGERWRQRHANRSSRAVVRSCLRSGEDHRNSPGSRAARDATLHRTRRPTHYLADSSLPSIYFSRCSWRNAIVARNW